MPRRFSNLVDRRLAVATLAIITGLTGAAFAAGMAISAGKLTVVTVPGSVPAQTCTLSAATADAFVDEASPGDAFGSATALDVRSGTSDRRAFARFNLAGCSLPAGAWVNSATLKLHLSSAPAASRTYEAHRVTAAWDEAAISWNGQPAVAASATSTATVGTTSPATVEWAVTADVRAFADGTATDHGWRIRDGDEAATPDMTSVFSSREHATPAQRPSLTISYYP